MSAPLPETSAVLDAWNTAQSKTELYPFSVPTYAGAKRFFVTHRKKGRIAVLDLFPAGARIVPDEERELTGSEQRGLDAIRVLQIALLLEATALGETETARGDRVR